MVDQLRTQNEDMAHAHQRELERLQRAHDEQLRELRGADGTLRATEQRNSELLDHVQVLERAQRQSGQARRPHRPSARPSARAPASPRTALKTRGMPPPSPCRICTTWWSRLRTLHSTVGSSRASSPC